MPDFQYDGTLRIESNDPSTPREIALKAVQSTYFVPVTFTSYSGTATIHGITELADVSDPPKKYQNLIPNEGNFDRQENDPGLGLLSPIYYHMLNRTAVNDLDVKYEQMQIGTGLGNKGSQFGFPGYTDIPLGCPWWMGFFGGGFGGSGVDSMEEVVAPGLVSYGWAESVPNWTQLPFSKDKRTRTLKAPDGFDVDSDEHLDSPVLNFKSWTIGSTTDSKARFTIKITAERGTAGKTYNIYVVWGMSQYATGSGPAAQVYLQARRGNQSVVCDDITGMRLGSVVAGPGSGSVYLYRRFGLPWDCSFRLFGKVVGQPASTQYQFPVDWAREEARITDDELTTVAQSPWFYFPEEGAPGVPDSSLLRLQTYKEVLVNEDPLPDALIADGGTSVATNQWARTVSVTGGIAAESHDPITIEGETVRASFTMPGLTPLQVYTVELTYEQRLIGSADSTFLKESIDVYPGLDTSKLVEFDVIAPEGYERRLYGTSVTGSAPQPEEGDGVDRVNELVWEADAIDNGATYTEAETAAVGDFLAALASKPYKNNLKYVLPFFGDDVASQIQPIVDFDFYGPPTNTGFVDGDCSTAGGMKGNGSSKILTMPFKYSDLRGSANGFGMGVWFNDWDISGTAGGNIGSVWNAAPTQVYGVAVSGANIDFQAGDFANVARFAASGADNIDYYGQKVSDISRKIFRTGLLLDEDTTSDISTDMGYAFPFLFGDNLGGTRYNASSLHVAYYTDGTLSDASVLDLHNLIETHLITAVGR